MPTDVKISVHGAELYRRKIQAMRYRALDFSPVLSDVGDDVLVIIEEQFATEGLRTGSRWKDLQDATIVKRGSAHPILVDTAEMLVEVTDESSIHVSSDEVKLEFPENIRERAMAHQHGFTNPQGTEVAARPIFEFTDIDRRRFNSKITNWLVHGDARI